MDKSNEVPTPRTEEIAEVTEASETDQMSEGQDSTSQESPSTSQGPSSSVLNQPPPEAEGNALPDQNFRRNQKCKRVCDKIVENLQKLDKLYNTEENPNRFQYYFKAKYVHFIDKGKEKVTTYEEGEHYDNPEPKSTTPRYVTEEQLREGLEQVRKEMALQSTGLKRMNETTPTKEQSATTTSSPAVFPSPVSTAIVTQRTSCMDNNCSFPSSDAWIGCKIEGCNYWVHAKCYGFPLASESDVDDMPKFFCPLHLI